MIVGRFGSVLCAIIYSLLDEDFNGTVFVIRHNRRRTRVEANEGR